MKTQLIKKVMHICAALMIAGLSFMACNNNSERTSSEQTGEKNDAIPASFEASRTDISFKDRSGKTVTLSSLRGKVVFINFWATWCPPCIQEMSSINKLRQSYKGNDKMVFLMVDVDANVEKSTSFMEQKRYDLPVYVPFGSIPTSFLADAIPTTVILDKSGDIKTRIEGGRDYSSPDITKVLDDLLEAE